MNVHVALSKMHLRNFSIQRQNRKPQTVPFVNFLFRFWDPRANREVVALLMENYHRVVDACRNRPRTREISDVLSALLTGAFTQLPDELLDSPYPMR